MPLKWFPGHYYQIGVGAGAMDEIPGAIDTLVSVPAFRGLQIPYWWEWLESAKDVYTFDHVVNALDALDAIGKKCVIQLQYKTFKTPNQTALPSYLLTPEYDGGSYNDGTVVKRMNAVLWNDALFARLLALIDAMAAAIGDHPALSGLNVIESALSKPVAPAPLSTLSAAEWGVLSATYIHRSRELTMHMRDTMPDVPVWHYFNSGSTQVPEQKAVALSHGVGAGGPDTWIAAYEFNTWSIHGYDYAKDVAGLVPVMFSVQWPNYSDYYNNHTTPATDPRASNPIPHIWAFDQEHLKSNYKPWRKRNTEILSTGVTYWQRLLELLDDLVLQYGDDPALGCVTTVPSLLVGGDLGRSNYGTRPEIPGTVAAYAFDQRTQNGSEVGGEGVTYHDTTSGNTLDPHARVLTNTTFPDVSSATGASQAWKLRQNRIGEWQEWTIDVPVTATVIPRIEYAAPEDTASPAVRVTLDGATIANLSLPSTGAWGTFATADGAPVTIAAGTGRVLRVECLSAGYDWTQLAFVTTTDPGGEVDPGAPGPAASTDLRLKYWSR